MTTRKPRAAAAIAVARPMPRLPPVMIATLSIKFAPKVQNAFFGLDRLNHDFGDCVIVQLVVRSGFSTVSPVERSLYSPGFAARNADRCGGSVMVWPAHNLPSHTIAIPSGLALT